MTARLSVLSLCFLAIFTAASLFLGAHTAHAQQGAEGLQIKPAVIEDRADPGSAYTYTIRVTNISASEKLFYINAQDIVGLTDAGLPIFSNEDELTPYEMSTWISVPERSITLLPEETREISFTITVPADASPGSHFAGLFLDSEPQRQRVTGAAVGMRVGSIISLRISGNILEEAQLREFSTRQIVYGNPSVDFEAKVANLGNVLLRPRGIVEITNMRGTKVASIKVNDSAAPVFPGSDKTYTVKWETEGFAFGRYQAVISLVYGEDGRKTITAPTGFWVLPLKPILTVLGGLFACILALYIFVKLYIAKKLREMGVTGSRRADLYMRRNQSPVPRMLLVALSVLFFSIVFLIALFLLFA